MAYELNDKGKGVNNFKKNKRRKKNNNTNLLNYINQNINDEVIYCITQGNSMVAF